MGENVKSLWTGTSCIGSIPGRIYNIPVVQCAKDQFIEEVKTQILECQSLDTFIREANSGRSLKDFKITKIEVWHEWHFSSNRIKPVQPKWVTTMTTQAFLPNQETSISNLLLAGAHTKTEADVWSIEGAVESGRRAAKTIDSRVHVLSQYNPLWLRVISAIDDVCFILGAPHILDILPFAILIAILAAILQAGKN